MEGEVMRRKGFLLNSAVIALLIPLLLLLATYEDVSSQIINAQSERGQVERTWSVVSYLNVEFEKALEISGKRAVVTAVDYVATTGHFIPSTINGAPGANTTIASLIKTGTFPFTPGGYNPQRLMRNQTLISWFSNVSSLLRQQGYTLSGNVSSVDLIVAPLDAFTLVIKARIPNVTITDSSGKVVYTGPIPSDGSYAYSTVDLRGLEDPMFSAVTGGRYHRSIEACRYAYPTLGIRPVLSVNGTGSSESPYIVGRFVNVLDTSADFSNKLIYNSTHIWNESGAYITNLTIRGVPVHTDSLVLHDGDWGVLVFSGVSESSGGTWCESGMEYRVNLTLPSSVPLNSLVLLVFDSTAPFSKVPHDGNRASIRIYKAGSSCEQAPYWIEYWGDNRILIWINTTNTRE